MNIYEIGSNGYWTGASRSIQTSGGMPKGWTRITPPALSVGEYALWIDGWNITTDAPVVIRAVAKVNAQVELQQTINIAIVSNASRLIQTQRIMAQMVIRGQV
jgi:hypothetical protein